jgi:hypothetical protein
MAEKKTKKFDVGTYPYTHCREQHVWEPYDGAIDKKAKRGYRIQRCVNCPTKKHSVINLDPKDYENYGRTVSNSYRYPTDYHITGGIASRERGLIRVHNFMAELTKEIS